MAENNNGNGMQRGYSWEEGENVTYYHLDPIIKKYDKDSYFEAETSGRWIALVNKKCLK